MPLDQITMAKHWMVAVFLLLTVVSRAVPAREPNDVSLNPTWRLQWANDIFVDSDNQFTDGFSMQKHSALASNLDDTQGTAAVGKGLARILLPDADDLFYREGSSFGQNIQTPEDIGRSELILNDVPYVGMMGWTSTFSAFNDRQLTAFAMLLGWVGPATLAEQMQDAIHDLLGSDEPKGWEYQLDDEALLNFYFMRKRKLWRGRRFDGAFGYDAALGNFFTFGQASLEMRFGSMPPGFAFVPAPVGRGIDYDARLTPLGSSRLYGSIVLRGTRFLLALPREGNNFTESNPWTQQNSVEKEDWVGQVIVGVHMEREGWAAHFDYWLSTDTIEKAGLFPGEDAQNHFAAITFEWQF